MLVNDFRAMHVDPVLARVASLSTGGSPRQEETGIYQIGHFGSSDFLRDGYKDQYQITLDESKDPYEKGNYFPNYGVCDNYQQILDKCPLIKDDPDRKFVITLTEVSKWDEPPLDGWRFSKWGQYIGDFDIQGDYIYDEPEIEDVYVFHIYEKE